MKQRTATAWLIILNVLAYFAGAWAAFGSMIDAQSIGEAVGKSIIFLVVFPAPLVFVWRFFRFTYDFTKKKFFLCTLLPPYIVTLVFGFIVLSWGLTGLLITFLCNAVTLCLIISTVIWVSVGGRGEKSPNKAAAIVLLVVCGALVFWRLFGLLNSPVAAMVGFVYRKEPISAAMVVRYIFRKLVPAAVLALPVGYGVSKLMKIYREEYSLKPPLFMLCAFVPNLLIAGVRVVLEYLGDKEKYFYTFEFRAPLDTFIMTAALALVSAIIYSVAAFIRSRKHYY